MKKKEFFLQNYLEEINFDESIFPDPNLEFKSSLEAINPEDKQFNDYPFNKEKLIAYIQSEEFLLSTNLTGLQNNNLSKLPDNFEIHQILEHLPSEKKEAEIELEKRRRYQAYKLLDYNLSYLTYFDFFSYDLFQIAKMSKYLAKIYGQKKVSLSFLYISS